MRHAIPEANPRLVELLSLSITFPLKITLGIPLYWAAIRSCVRQVLQKGMEVLVEVGVLVGSRTGCAA